MWLFESFTSMRGVCEESFLSQMMEIQEVHSLLVGAKDNREETWRWVVFVQHRLDISVLVHLACSDPRAGAPCYTDLIGKSRLLEDPWSG